MNGAVIEEMQALDPDVVVVKGDLTERGTEEQFAAFLAAYGVFGDRLAFVRGNHDAMLDPTLAIEGAPYSVEVGGVTLAVARHRDPRPRRRAAHGATSCSGSTTSPLETARSGPRLRPPRHMADRRAGCAPTTTSGSRPPRREALAALVARRDNIAGYFAGHTHGNRVLPVPVGAQRALRRGGVHQGLPGRVGRVPRVRGRLHAGGPPRHGARQPSTGPSRRAACSSGSTASSRAATSRPAASPSRSEDRDGGRARGDPRRRHGDAHRRARTRRATSPTSAPTSSRSSRRRATAPATLGWRDPADGTALYWKQVGRNKRPVVLDLKTPTGLERDARLVDRSDVLVENFRPGHARTPRPRPRRAAHHEPGARGAARHGLRPGRAVRGRPGFATMAEAMGGFAAINGAPDGPPLLPPIALTDEVTALVGRVRGHGRAAPSRPHR